MLCQCHIRPWVEWYLRVVGKQNDEEFSNELYEEWFSEVDTNKDGRVSVSEAHRIFFLMGYQYTMDEVQQCFGLYDRKGDGELNKEEFRKAAREIVKGKLQRKAAIMRAFNALVLQDGNKDGHIDREQLRQILEQHRQYGQEPLDDDEFDAVFNAIDTNGNGFVKANDLIEYLATH